MTQEASTKVHVMTMPRFMPRPVEKRRGPKPRYQSGTQLVMSVRIPKEAKDQLTLFHKNHPEYTTISHIVVTALAQFLRDHK